MDEAQELRLKAREISVNSVHSKPYNPAAEAAAAKEADPNKKEESNILSPKLLELAHTALKHPELAETDHLLRWKRANPPDALFLVDDVYISAYLACRGIPRFVVPSTASAQIPIPRVGEGKTFNLPPQPPRPESAGGSHVDLSAVNALHGEAHFNLGNAEAVRFFRQMVRIT
jgi:hypothetical protein